MPSPQLGVLMKDDDASIKQLLEKISTSVKIRVKEPSVKISVGKESMKDEHLIENIQAIYNGLVSALPTKKENIKNILIKTTMSKPVAVEMK
jgi:ribosomal protein L1